MAALPGGARCPYPALSNAGPAASRDLMLLAISLNELDRYGSEYFRGAKKKPAQCAGYKLY